MDHNHTEHNCSCHIGSVATQSMEELEFSRSLLNAAMGGDENKVLSIINSGKSVNLTDDYGYTALHYASRNGHISIVKLLVSKGAIVDSKV